MKRRIMIVPWLVSLLCVLCFPCCSDGDGGGEGVNGDASTGTGSEAGQGGGGAGQGGGSGGAECVEVIVGGETVPLDIYIMFDQSGSMLTEEENGQTRIEAVRSATADFLEDPASHGIGAGIGYFGDMPLGETSCDPANYRQPDVEIDLLPDHAEEIIDSLDRVEPTGETPTGAAIEGACAYAGEWKKDNPEHVVVILLVTDGEPKAPLSASRGCEPTLVEAIDAAMECAGSEEEIRIYVLGVGSALDNLNQIALAGKTEQAYLVEGGDVSEKVLRALNDIRGDAIIPCEFLIPEPPPGETLDFGMVNAVYTDADGDSRYIYAVSDKDECDPTEGGWYYDDAEAPGRILLCDASCEVVGEPGGTFDLALGCETQLLDEVL